MMEKKIVNESFVASRKWMLTYAAGTDAEYQKNSIQKDVEIEVPTEEAKEMFW